MTAYSVKFPRAKDPSQVFALSGATWNALVAEVERLGNLNVAPPLMMDSGPGGTNLRVAVPGQPQTLVKVTDPADLAAVQQGTDAQVEESGREFRRLLEDEA